MDREDNVSFGVFKPVGHVVISFATAEQAKDAAKALDEFGLRGEAVRYFTDKQMLSQIAHDIERASPLAAIGQELNLVKAHRALAEQGYHWLIVHAPDNELAQRVADRVKPLGAERAQSYGHFIIEELIQHPGDMPQVGESPDRGLDPQTPSGEERERAKMRPPPEDS